MDFQLSHEDKLHLKGVKIDTTKAMGLDWCSHEMSISSVLALWRGLLEQQTDLDLRVYLCGGTYRQAFWRTITRDVALCEGSTGVVATYGRIPMVDDERDGGTVESHWPKTAFLDVGSRFFLTSRGFIGIGTSDTRVGDSVFVLFGGNTPFVLRGFEDVDRGGCYQFVGH